MVTTDRVILIPGFLGFDKIGNFPYFSDQVVPLLKGCVQAEFDRQAAAGAEGRRCEVHVVDVRPTASLKSRQEELLEQLSDIQCVKGERWHLLGHSTGAVDARLLLAPTPLRRQFFRKRWSPVQNKMRQRVQSIVGIAGPHHGTWLVDDPYIAKLANNDTALIGLFELVVQGAPFEILASAFGDPTVHALLYGLLTDWGSRAEFIWNILKTRRLLHDLHPQFMSRFNSVAVTKRMRSVVTVASSESEIDGETRKGDSLYRWLIERTEAKTASCPQGARERARSLEVIKAARDSGSVPVIANAQATRRRLDLHTSDAVVNTAHQLYQADTDELLAIVVADHIDVVGYHGDGKGVVKSGSGFGETQLEELYALIAAEISRPV